MLAVNDFLYDFFVIIFTLFVLLYVRTEAVNLLYVHLIRIFLIQWMVKLGNFTLTVEQ